jgi:hypothetical protein
VSTAKPDSTLSVKGIPIEEVMKDDSKPDNVKDVSLNVIQAKLDSAIAFVSNALEADEARATRNVS